MTTSRKRPPPVSDHFVNNRFVSVKYCSKSSLVSDHYSNFLSDRNQFLGQRFDFFRRPVSDHQTWSRTILRKSLLRSNRSSVFDDANGTDDSKEDVGFVPFRFPSGDTLTSTLYCTFPETRCMRKKLENFVSICLMPWPNGLPSNRKWRQVELE